MAFAILFKHSYVREILFCQIFKVSTEATGLGPHLKRASLVDFYWQALIANNILGCHIKTQVLGVFLLSTENYMVRKVRRRLFQGRARARLGVWDLSERRYCRALSVMIRWSLVCPQTTVSHSFDICDKRKVPKSTQWSVLKVLKLIDIKYYVYTITVNNHTVHKMKIYCFFLFIQKVIFISF